MPFVSQQQRKYMYSQEPKLAKKFEKETPKGQKLPKKVKKEDYNPSKMYVVVKPTDNMDASGMIMELNPLEGIQPLNIMQDDVITTTHDEKDAQRIAEEAYENYCKESEMLEEKKGKVGSKIKTTIDQLEKKRKNHIKLAKDNPEKASDHKKEISKISNTIQNLLDNLEKIEKSKKNVEKKDLKESILGIMANEGYSQADKKAINDLVVKSIVSTALSGANPKSQILNARVIDDTTIELVTEFETVQYTIRKIKP
jgi:hypothetical protein